jgi:hypothetical protein
MFWSGRLMKKIFRWFFMVFGLAYFAVALVLPTTRWGEMFKGTGYEKLKREPLLAAMCFLWILCLIFLKKMAEMGYLKIGRRGLLLISMLALVIASLAAYFAHLTVSLMLLTLTTIQFGKDTPTEKE